MPFPQQLPRASAAAVGSLGTRGSQTAAGGAGLWSQGPASGAEEFTALLMLTRYFSPQLLLSSHVSLLCCVSQRALTQKEALSSAVFIAIILSFPSPDLGSVSGASQGAWMPGVRALWLP